MRKSSILAIILGTLFGLGLLFTVIGLLMGATIRSLNIITNEKGLHVSTSDGSSPATQELPAGQVQDIKNLDIDIYAHSLEIYEGDSFSISGGFLTKNEIEGDTWYIEAERKWSTVKIFGFISIPVLSDMFEEKRKTLTITIPKGHHFDTVSLGAGAVSIAVDNLTCNDLLRCNVSAGSIQIDSLSTKNAEIDCSVGDISIKQYNISESGIFDCSMGSIELGNKHTIDSNLCNNFEADCSMGNISCYGMFTASGNKGKCTADCGMGNIDLHLRGTRDNYEFTTSTSLGSLDYSGTGTDNQAATPTPMHLDCNMGNIDISFH